MKKKIVKELLPLIWLAGGLAYTAIAYLTSNVGLTWRHYLGFSATAVIGALYKTQPQYFKKALGAMLLLSTFNVLAFTPTITTVTIGIASVSISFQPFSLVAFLIFITINRERVLGILGMEATNEASIGDSYLDEEKFERLKSTYSRKSVEELNNIINSGQFTIEAVAAAKEILEAKTHSNIV